MPHEIPKYMSPSYVKDKTSVDILWRQLGTLQDIAEEFGIDNIFQDNGAEILQQLIYLNMKAVPGREGNDGVDINGCEWEMKSLDISKNNLNITTNHHLNYDIIDKYRTVPWSISLYSRVHLKQIYIIGNEHLVPLFESWEEKLRNLELEGKTPSLNNPKIPFSYFQEQGILIYTEGDEYPLNPTLQMDTSIYLPRQEMYRNRVSAEKIRDLLKKAIVNQKKKAHALEESYSKLSIKDSCKDATLKRTLKRTFNAIEKNQEEIFKLVETFQVLYKDSEQLLLDIQKVTIEKENALHIAEPETSEVERREYSNWSQSYNLCNKFFKSIHTACNVVNDINIEAIQIQSRAQDIRVKLGCE